MLNLSADKAGLFQHQLGKYMKRGFLYIMANDRPTLYIGVTDNLVKRVYQHIHKLVEGFTKRYHVYKLLYFEEYNTIEEAITREKQLKRWHRDWKMNLIKSTNPNFEDLYSKIV